MKTKALRPLRRVSEVKSVCVSDSESVRNAGQPPYRFANSTASGRSAEQTALITGLACAQKPSSEETKNPLLRHLTEVLFTSLQEIAEGPERSEYQISLEF